MESRPLLHEDASSVWIINEQGLPGTGKVTVDGKKEEILKRLQGFS